MSKTKQLIERNLPFDQKYIYLSITRGSIENGQAMACANCGQLITNLVTVVNKDTKKQYIIGTECADTLAKAKCLYNNGDASDYQMDIYSYNQAARFVTEVNAGQTMKFTWEGHKIALTNRKGKEMEIWKNDLVKFFPEYLAQVQK